MMKFVSYLFMMFFTVAVFAQQARMGNSTTNNSSKVVPTTTNSNKEKWYERILRIEKERIIKEERERLQRRPIINVGNKVSVDASVVEKSNGWIYFKGENKGKQQSPKKKKYMQ